MICNSAWPGSSAQARRLPELDTNGLAQPLTSIHLWLVDLDSPQADESVHWLCRAERQRAERFVFPVDARRYRAAHIALRQLLQQHCDEPAGSDFEVNPFGRPRLARPNAPSFSLSHSGNRALVGICGQHEIGVDIELLHGIEDLWSLAEQSLSKAEVRDLHQMPADDAARGFLIAWTRKEACLKAIGRGLSLAPNSFAVGLSPSPRTLTMVVDGGELTVHVQSLALGEGVLGAVALASTSRQDFDLAL